MEYFMIKSNAVVNPEPARISNAQYPYLLSDENFARITDKFVDYYHLHADTEIPGLMTHPTFMCNDQLKHIMEIYDPYIEWKSLYLVPGEESQQVLGTYHYWIPNMTRQDCVHKDCVQLPNGSLQNVILDKTRMRNMDVFQVGGTQENIVVVSLPLAESISRRHIYGIKLCKVEVR